jgi:hypothetical protein
MPTSTAKGKGTFLATSNTPDEAGPSDQSMDIDPPDLVVSNSGTSHSSKCKVSALAHSPADSVNTQWKKRSSSSATKGTAPNSALAAKITPAVAIAGMQGSINRLTDVFEKSLMLQETTSTKLSEALQRLQDLDDGLTNEEKLVFIQLFGRDPVIAGTYLALTCNDLWRDWIQKMLRLERNWCSCTPVVSYFDPVFFLLDVPSLLLYVHLYSIVRRLLLVCIGVWIEKKKEVQKKKQYSYKQN